MRILITGSRELTDKYLVYDAIAQAVLEHQISNSKPWEQPVTVIHGAAKGADSLAGRWADILEGFEEERHPADWDKHGKKAGPIRNQEMVDLGADVCLAFFKQGAGNRGTSDCVSRAEKAGIPTRMYTQDECS